MIKLCWPMYHCMTSANNNKNNQIQLSILLNVQLAISLGNFTASTK